jgi:hypothetical protein
MSLINDALKNARKKADQPRQSPVDGLALRPPEPAQPTSRNAWLIPGAIGLAFALVAIAAAGFYLSRNSSNTGPSPEKLTVNARELAPATPSAAAANGSTVQAEPGSAPAPISPPAKEPPATAVTRTVVGVAPAAPAPAMPAATVAPSPAPNAITQPAPAAISAPAPQPEPLRLQAIVYHPTRPSALISGKTVFVGERVQGMKVTGITKDSATVADNRNVLVLKLPE